MTPFASFVTGFKALNLLGAFKLTLGRPLVAETEQIMLIEYDGIPSRDLPFESIFVQVTVTSTSYAGCRDKAWALYKALRGKKQWTAGSHLIQEVNAVSTPKELGYNRKNTETVYQRVFNLWFVTVD